ncbi:hypothetical protein FKZ61_002605 [Litorilinea aerophila]|uniref:Uncharacterized protein n=1 Tax=Litorilinea aerophila TaxID=1204385 RepID=A0A540VKT0_9CHLR|nr:hypothetical protein [Litorilinea aerophila]MCC9075004.1 hypothetical protein [Litorilinea aerophila]
MAPPGSIPWPSLWRLLVVAMMVDWLVTRTFTRLAIYMPKTSAMIEGFWWLNWGGQAGSAVAAVAALACLTGVALAEWRGRRNPWLSGIAVGLGVPGVLFGLWAPGPWLLFFHGLTLAFLLGLGVRIMRLRGPWGTHLALITPGLAMGAATLYQAIPALYVVLQWSGPPPWSLHLFYAGEALVVAGAGALWWVYGRSSDFRLWCLAALPVLLATFVYLAAPAMTATVIIWSHGVTLFLPWWLYGAALWLWGVTLLCLWKQGAEAQCCALLLLMASGYAPQLSSQLVGGLLSLWLFEHSVWAGSWNPRADTREHAYTRHAIWI